MLDSKAREVLFAPIKERFGHLDIVFANAGIAKIGSIEETSETMFDEVLRTNLTGVLLTIQAGASSSPARFIHYSEWFDWGNYGRSRFRILSRSKAGL